MTDTTFLESRAYASFGRRLHALSIDAIVLAAGLVAIAIIGDVARNVPGSGRVLVVLLYALLLFYEPLLVWRFGATVGHRAANIHVVDDATGGPPPFWRASVRYVVKTVLGLVSFTAMATTRRHQAIHDAITHTTVQIRDLGRAAPNDYYRERVRDVADPSLPPPGRRILVILLYSAVLYVGGAVAAGVAIVLLGRDDRKVIQDLFALVWVGGTLLITIAGWQGQLLGARRSRSQS